MHTRLLALWALCLGLAASSAAVGQEVERGRNIYDQHCASCHGIDLKGEPGHPDWRQRKANGRLPAPPHDESGHTWHHPDAQLFAITKHGPGKLIGDPDYPTDMPGFDGVLSDAEITALARYVRDVNDWD